MVRATRLLPEVKSHYGDLQNYVGGGWREPQATEWIEDTNPATGHVIARVPLSTKEDVDVAVQEALRAWMRGGRRRRWTARGASSRYGT